MPAANRKARHPREDVGTGLVGVDAGKRDAALSKNPKKAVQGHPEKPSRPMFGLEPVPTGKKRPRFYWFGDRPPLWTGLPPRTKELRSVFPVWWKQQNDRGWPEESKKGRVTRSVSGLADAVLRGGHRHDTGSDVVRIPVRMARSFHIDRQEAEQQMIEKKIDRLRSLRLGGCQ